MRMTKLEMLRDYFEKLRVNGTAVVPIGFDDALDDLLALADAVNTYDIAYHTAGSRDEAESRCRMWIAKEKLMQPAEEVRGG